MYQIVSVLGLHVHAYPLITTMKVNFSCNILQPCIWLPLKWSIMLCMIGIFYIASYITLSDPLYSSKLLSSDGYY